MVGQLLKSVNQGGGGYRRLYDVSDSYEENLREFFLAQGKSPRLTEMRPSNWAWRRKRIRYFVVGGALLAGTAYAFNRIKRH
jgi:hypothetical protein